MTVGRIPSVEGGIQPTIVDAKGDLIAAVAADSLNRLAVGSNDQVLVADSAASTGLAWKSYGAQVVAGKNAVINGGFDIWQRGTSISTLANNTYCADRWTGGGGGAAMTVSRQDTGDTTNLPNIQYAARVQRDNTNANTNNRQFVQTIETANSIVFAGKTVTVSFYARAGANFSAASNLLKVNAVTGTGTDQSAWTGFTGSTTALDTSVTLTTTWQRFSATTSFASTAKEIYLNFFFTPTGTAGAADFFEITGVQLEVGSVATPFSRAGGTIQGELAACQRYYERITSEAAYGLIGTGKSNTPGNLQIFLPFKVTKRITPSSIDTSAMSTFSFETGVTAGNTPSVIAINTVVSNSNSVTLDLNKNTNPFTVGAYYILIGNNTAAAYVGASAEL